MNSAVGSVYCLKNIQHNQHILISEYTTLMKRFFIVNQKIQHSHYSPIPKWITLISGESKTERKVFVVWFLNESKHTTRPEWMTLLNWFFLVILINLFIYLFCSFWMLFFYFIKIVLYYLFMNHSSNHTLCSGELFCYFSM